LDLEHDLCVVVFDRSSIFGNDTDLTITRFDCATLRRATNAPFGQREWN
jgi:hypothetical protein